MNKIESTATVTKEKAIELAIKEASKWIDTEKFYIINSLKVDDGFYFEFGTDEIVIDGPGLFFVTNGGDAHVVASNPGDPENDRYFEILYQQEEQNEKKDFIIPDGTRYDDCTFEQLAMLPKVPEENLKFYRETFHCVPLIWMKDGWIVGLI